MRNKNHQAIYWTCNLFVDYLKRLVSLINECIILHNFSFESVFIFWSPCKICSSVGVGMLPKTAWISARNFTPLSVIVCTGIKKVHKGFNFNFTWAPELMIVDHGFLVFWQPFMPWKIQCMLYYITCLWTAVLHHYMCYMCIWALITSDQSSKGSHMHYICVMQSRCIFHIICCILFDVVEFSWNSLLLLYTCTKGHSAEGLCSYDK